MSRTQKGGKSPGFDYWTPRPRKGTAPQGMAAGYGPYTKRLTHRSERRISRASVSPHAHDT